MELRGKGRAWMDPESIEAMVGHINGRRGERGAIMYSFPQMQIVKAFDTWQVPLAF